LIARANNATTTINNLAGPGAADDASVPQALLRDSVCIVTIPGYKKAGFVFGGSFGAGLAACRNAQGQFEAPFFVTLVGGSWGLQIGVESTDLMLVMTEADAQSQLTAAGGIQLGVEGSVAAGPLGRDTTAGTNGDFHEETLSYSTSRGIFAGLTLTGAKLSSDENAAAGEQSSADVATAVIHYQSTLNSLIAAGL
jgi:lipid-binding SYLF domain-containing protein